MHHNDGPAHQLEKAVHTSKDPVQPEIKAQAVSGDRLSLQAREESATIGPSQGAGCETGRGWGPTCWVIEPFVQHLQ